MPVTITEIAEAAGVSLTTVSRALNNIDHPMNKDTKERILKIAREMGYQPNLVARSLRMDRTFNIGIIVENIQSPFTPPIIRGIQDYLKPEGYSSTIINSDWDPKIESDAIQSLNNRQIDGIIFVETWHRSSDAVEMMTNKPFVFVHRLFNGHCPNSVIPDDYGGARLIVHHLLELGHRRIAYIDGPKDWDASKNRLKGYKDEMADSNIPYDNHLVKRGDWEVKGGYLATQAWIGVENPPTAIFAANDLMALGAIYALQEKGLRVPQDIAIAGYDNRNFTSFVRPSITTVTLPCYEMGESAAKLLLNFINGEVKETEPIEILGHLIVRESCGAIEGKWQFEDDQGSSAWRKKRRKILHNLSGGRNDSGNPINPCP
jgi:DNA-binding LacI/PurR family transcriptional regulator